MIYNEVDYILKKPETMKQTMFHAAYKRFMKELRTNKIRIHIRELGKALNMPENTAYDTWTRFTKEYDVKFKIIVRPKVLVPQKKIEEVTE